MPTGPNYRPNIQLPNLMGNTGDPYNLNLYPQDMIFEKPPGWDDTKGVIDTSNPQVMKASMLPDISNINWSGILEGGKNLFGFGNNEPPTGINPRILDTYQRSPHRGLGDVTTTPYMFQDMTVDEERIPGRIQEEGVTKQGFQFPSVIGGIGNFIKDQFEYRPATEEAWDPNTGEFISAEEQNRQNALGGYYSDAARNARRNRARVVNMMKRRDAHKGYSKKNLEELIRLGYGPAETITTTTVGDNINTGGGGGSEAAFTQTSPGEISQATSRAARTDQGGNVMSGWRLAEGGRIGYRNGEFVDEDVNIQGPGFDVNENIEMASAPNPLAELNSFSLEIFKKPFDQLDDDEREILFEMMNDQAGMDQGEGIASLV